MPFQFTVPSRKYLALSHLLLARAQVSRPSVTIASVQLSTCGPPWAAWDGTVHSLAQTQPSSHVTFLSQRGLEEGCGAVRG